MTKLLEILSSSGNPEVVPGESVELRVSISNKGTSDDTAVLQIDFSDPSWVALPVASTAIGPSQSRSLSIIFKPPHTPSSVAGSYPFVIHCRSLETGASETLQGSLRVLPYHDFTFAIVPLRGYANPLSPNVQYDLQISNSGNTTQSYDLSIENAETTCSFQFSEERISVAPGERVEVPLIVQPRRRPLLASPVVTGFQVNAMPLLGNSPPETAHGHLEYRALLSPFSAVILAFVLACAGFWIWQRSQLPVINRFEATQTRITAGDPVKIIFVTSNASHLVLHNDTINESYPLQVNIPYRIVQPLQTTVYTLIAKDDAGHEARKSLEITVTPAMAPPVPSIISFQATPPQVEFGKGVILTWKVLNAQSLLLAPLGKQIDLTLPALELQPSELPQTRTLTLIAKNSTGSVSKNLTIKVIPPVNPAAPIISLFAATPPSVQENEMVTLSWNVQGASSISISGIGVVAAQGSQTFPVQRSTVFTLSATAPSGIVLTKNARVRVAAPINIRTFSALPNSIQPGQSAQLVWKVQNAASVTIDGIGPVDSSGFQDIKPAQTTTYTLHALDAAGRTAVATITVNVQE